ncbi:MAG: DUF2779 domain-containing protein [Candidatus Caenarcaniphilales bacterium]|jgi:hypothetical protein|nr:DUF2779 domain-containing protein [Candidatus Caenarcaniphilales bacterium]
MPLSKSQYLKALQCHKRLWLAKFRPELAEPVSEAQQAIFDQGTLVGKVAQGLFANGIEIAFTPDNFAGMINETQALLEQHPNITIYEATFKFQDCFAMLDILVKTPAGLEIYEVKSSTGAKDVYLEDLSFQVYILQSLGYPISKACLININNDYIFDGLELNLEELFKIEDFTQELFIKAKHVPHLVSQMQNTLSSDEPHIDIGVHCSKPYKCEFTNYCWSHIPDVSVFSLSDARGKDWELYKQGYIKLEDIPLNKSTRSQISSKHIQQIECYLENKTHINQNAIDNQLSQIQFPIAFLDFESFQDAIPRLRASKPFEQIPFQYSLHILESPDGELMHYEFLAKADQDPRYDFISSLMRDLPKSGSIVVYNRSFEAGVLKKLACEVPEFEPEINQALERFFDLMLIFQRRDYYHPDMQGRYSIKNVLPALIPQLSYKDLAIGEGKAASRAFVKLRDQQDLSEKIRADLLAYCKLDTLAMVEIWKQLIKL